MLKYQALKVTVEISTSVLYPWEIGDYFKYNGQKYRIEKIIRETKQARIDGTIGEISADTPIDDQIITSLVVGTLVR
ncbi:MULTISPECIES: hypothetical protein [unclassified Chamaesiphon]|uniref:hypothetical protein n=1 Tax=unclassified Chamaesiphon TaxID=2620921 RepID=UPI00286B174C|nr:MULTISPECIES: hypothetical protein [unclassified Chamaesiphon]